MARKLMRSNDPFVAELMKVLDLPERAVDFTLRVCANELVMVECTYYASREAQRAGLMRMDEFAFSRIDRSERQRIALKEGLCSAQFTRDFNHWLRESFGSL